jgi:DNA (cytosine-5)-methyltransferase 1
VILNHLDLFSGIGGFSLGLERTGGFRTIGFCETDAYCTKVLQKNFPGIPIHGDIKKLKGTHFGAVDIITGGYPCQSFSVAGKQKGVEDPRHLWPEYFRIIKESRPTWVIGENVAGHIKLGLDSVIEDLEGEGYATRTFSISASSIGANHQRERIWIIAHSDKHGSHSEKTHEAKQGGNGKENGLSFRNDNDVANTESDTKDGVLRTASSEHGKGNARMEFDGSRNGQPKREAPQDMADTHSEGSQGSGMETNMEEETFHQSARRSGQGREQDVADAERIGQQGQGKPVRPGSAEENCERETDRLVDESERTQGWWDIEPDVGRVAHGIPKRVDRLKALGNSLIPHIPYYIGQSIIATYEDNDTV